MKSPQASNTVPMSEDARIRFKRFAMAAENVDWPGRLARTDGWPRANVQYQAHQRAIGKAEMSLLLHELRLKPPIAPENVPAVIQRGTLLLLNSDSTHVRAGIEDEGICILSSACPLFDRLSDRHWSGVSACGCFARLVGWYDAMEVEPDIEVVSNRKWGDQECGLLAHLR